MKIFKIDVDREVHRHLMDKKNKIISEITDEATSIQSEFWCGYFEKLSNDRKLKPEAFWKRVNRMLGRRGGLQYLVRDQRGSIALEEEEIEEIFRRNSLGKCCCSCCGKVENCKSDNRKFWSDEEFCLVLIIVKKLRHRS